MTKLPSFDRLLWLANNDPKQLDMLQRQLSEEVIEESSEGSKPKLKSLLSQLENKLSLCKTPYQRFHIVSNMMYQKLASLNEVLNRPDEFYAHKAKILNFSNKETKAKTQKAR